jgi:hypothetical protein
MRLSLPVLTAALVLGLPLGASAHLALTMPASRYGPDTLKTGPCGRSGGERTDIVSYFEPGETIEVRWEEYVDHPGHYRVAFDPDGDDDFVDPPTMMDFYSNEAVLLDGIEDGDRSKREYSVMVTLPDIECDNCTLQVIQVMYDKTPYEVGDDDIYYQCADLILRVGGVPDGGMNPVGGSGGTGGTMSSTGGAGGGSSAVAGDSGGCSVANHASGESWLAMLLLVLAVRRLAHTRKLTV